MQALVGPTTKATKREILTNFVSVSDEEPYLTASSDGDWRFEGKMTVGAEAVAARSETSVTTVQIDIDNV